MLAILPALLALAAIPETGETPVPTEAPAASAAVADADLREYAAIAGRKVAGRPVSGPYAAADKLLLLGRDDRGYPTTLASTGFPARQSLPPPPDGTLAIVRLHQKSEGVVPGPTADDLAFVAANRIPLFVIGEWARPAPMWEVAWLDGAVRFRSIGEVGEIGPWRE